MSGCEMSGCEKFGERSSICVESVACLPARTTTFGRLRFVAHLLAEALHKPKSLLPSQYHLEVDLNIKVELQSEQPTTTSLIIGVHTVGPEHPSAILAVTTRSKQAQSPCVLWAPQ